MCVKYCAKNSACVISCNPYDTRSPNRPHFIVEKQKFRDTEGSAQVHPVSGTARTRILAAHLVLLYPTA